jgi:hypothetical protein
MKLLLLAILATSITANATGNTPQGSTTNNFLNQIQGQHQTQENASNAQGGSSSVNYDNDTKMPASSAISPSVGTNNDCQISTPSSKAFSILIMSVSGTTGTTINPICYAYKRGQFDVADKLMCMTDKDYAKANPNCK